MATRGKPTERVTEQMVPYAAPDDFDNPEERGDGITLNGYLARPTDESMLRIQSLPGGQDGYIEMPLQHVMWLRTAPGLSLRTSTLRVSTRANLHFSDSPLFVSTDWTEVVKHVVSGRSAGEAMAASTRAIDERAAREALLHAYTRAPATTTRRVSQAASERPLRVKYDDAGAVVGATGGGADNQLYAFTVEESVPKGFGRVAGQVVTRRVDFYDATDAWPLTLLSAFAADGTMNLSVSHRDLELQWSLRLDTSSSILSTNAVLGRVLTYAGKAYSHETGTLGASYATLSLPLETVFAAQLERMAFFGPFLDELLADMLASGAFGFDGLTPDEVFIAYSSRKKLAIKALGAFALGFIAGSVRSGGWAGGLVWGAQGVAGVLFGEAVDASSDGATTSQPGSTPATPAGPGETSGGEPKNYEAGKDAGSGTKKDK